jgi:hypothetical protein
MGQADEAHQASGRAAAHPASIDASDLAAFDRSLRASRLQLEEECARRQDEQRSASPPASADFDDSALGK